MTGIPGSRASPPLAAALRTFYLAPHAATPCEAARSIEVRLTTRGGGALVLAYAIEGDARRVRLPEPVAPRRVDGLWRHTCFEAFIAPARATLAAPGRTQPGISEAVPPDGSDATRPGGPYIELNFSPSGEWAGFAFDGYRTGMRPLEGIEAPVITVDRDAGGARWRLHAAVDIGPVAGPQARLALAAVIEDADGRLAYWALRHPSDRPDFHHPGGFAAVL